MSDYVQMWKDLGMDLDTHDALCQVLPTAFGDVYLSQENRPEAMGFWDFVVSEIHGIRPSELIEAQKNGQKVSLSSKEYEVLEFLVKNAGQVISPEKIYQNVWKVEYGDITAVAVYIQRLRKKIEDNPSDCQYIKTEFGNGYIFSSEYITKN